MKYLARLHNTTFRTRGENSGGADYAPSGFFALRTPLLPFDELIAWGDGLKAPDSLNEHQRLEQALASDRVRLRKYLNAAFSRPELRDALFVASPDLDE